MREDPHSGSLTHVDGQLSHCPHLFNACASIEGAFQVPFKLSIDLFFLSGEFRISTCIGCRACRPPRLLCETPRSTSFEDPLRMHARPSIYVLCGLKFEVNKLTSWGTKPAIITKDVSASERMAVVLRT